MFAIDMFVKLNAQALDSGEYRADAASHIFRIVDFHGADNNVMVARVDDHSGHQLYIPARHLMPE